MDNLRTASDLKRLVSSAQLAALPQSAIRLLELSRDPDNGPNEFAVPIEADPGLTGQVLRFVNSSYFGFAREISSVRLAITMVGVRTIKNFALWSAVFSLVPSPRCGALDLKTLWQDSLRRALMSRLLGRLLGLKEPEEPFAAALLQDMGIPLLAKEAPGAYGRILAARENGRFRLSFLEEQVFGWTHAQTAAMMARHWNLPENFANLIETHSQIDRLIDERSPNMGAVAVALSSLLPALSDPGWSECPKFEQHYERLRPADAPSAVDLLAEVDREFVSFAPVMKMARPSKSLVDSYNEAAAPTA